MGVRYTLRDEWEDASLKRRRHLVYSILLFSPILKATSVEWHSVYGDVLILNVKGIDSRQVTLLLAEVENAFKEAYWDV